MIQLSEDISISDILKNIRLSKKYIGSKKIKFDNIASFKNNNTKSLVFLTKEIFNTKLKKKFSSIKSKIIITDFEEKKLYRKNLIITKNSRHYLNKVIQYLNNQSLIKENIYKNSSSYFSKNIQIGKNVKIGQNVKIYPNVYLDNCVIGNNVIIGPNTSIGYKGLVRYKYKNLKLNLISIGKVVIKENVEIGSNCIIARGTIENTLINKDVIIGNNTNIGHNTNIDIQTEISSGCKIGGGVIIKKNCFLGLGCKINPNTVIEKNNFIGVGSVVTKSTTKNSKLFGSPAKRISFLKKK